MGDFFKPWRRKIGVVTLAMACVLAVGWLRSIFVLDMVDCHATRETTILFCSVDQSMVWQKRDLNQPEPRNRFLYWSYLPWMSLDSPDVKIDWEWRWRGIGFGNLLSRPPYVSRIAILVVPYLFVTIPITLLSAWLLLSKPRVPAPRKISDPTPADGA